MKITINHTTYIIGYECNDKTFATREEANLYSFDMLKITGVNYGVFETVIARGV